MALFSEKSLILRGISEEENWLVSAAPFCSPTFSLCAGVFTPTPANFPVVIMVLPFLQWEQSKAIPATFENPNKALPIPLAMATLSSLFF